MSKRSDTHLCAHIVVGKEPSETGGIALDAGCEIDDQLQTLQECKSS